MRDILNKVTKWWEVGDTFGLATVVRTYRSAPRDPGAALAVSPDGEVVGSVSGGCVEGAVYELAQEVCESGQPVLQTYGISDDTAFDVGLTCGGIIELFVEPVSRERFPGLGDVAAAIRDEVPVAVATVIAGPGESPNGTRALTPVTAAATANAAATRRVGSRRRPAPYARKGNAGITGVTAEISATTSRAVAGRR